jgi:hypothetical protein
VSAEQEDSEDEVTVVTVVTEFKGNRVMASADKVG